MDKVSDLQKSFSINQIMNNQQVIDSNLAEEDLNSKRMLQNENGVDNVNYFSSSTLNPSGKD